MFVRPDDVALERVMHIVEECGSVVTGSHVI
jgi:hypothetical protein